MPKLSDPAAAPMIRGILLGDSGSGKTGALASLVKAGYNLYIADYDKGTEILRNLLIAEAKKDGKAEQFYTSKVDFETCRDPYRLEGNIVVPSAAIAWAKGIKYIENVTKNKLGGDDIIVMDSLSFAAKFCMNYVLHINGRLKGRIQQGDWGEAQRQVERLVDMLTGEGMPCHFLATAHIAMSGGKETVVDEDKKVHVIDNGPEKGLPAMIGQAINGIVPRYFNHTLLFRQVGSGASLARKIHTTTFDKIELKNTNPGVIKPEYPLATGLADYFKDARGTTPATK